MQVGTAFVPMTLRRAIDQYLREEIAERDRLVGASRREIESFEPTRPTRPARIGGATGVVPRSAVRVRQRLVGFHDLTESHLRRPVPRIDIRMKPPGEPAIRPPDLGLLRPDRQPEHHVQIHAGLLLLVVHHFRVDHIAVGTPRAGLAPGIR
jgi:hypothetical protein